MIQGNIKDVEKFLPYLSPRLQTALKFIAATDFSKLPNGQIEIEGRTIYAGINTYETEPKAERRPEKHNKYIDVQFIGRGEETVWYTPLLDSTITEDCFAERDVAFYTDPHERNCANLKAGDFCILFPWELHRPNCSTEATSSVQKIVVKVLAD